MAESHVISALVAKHSELAGLIKHHEKELERLSDELAAIHKSIKIFQPDYPVRTIKPKQHRNYSQFFKKGEGYKLVLDVLRDSQQPMNTNAIAEEAVKRKKLVLDEKCFAQIKASITNTLKNQAKRGVIQELEKVGWMNMWAVG